MKEITEEIFSTWSYCCPCYKGAYGRECIVLNDNCCYINCPTLFWVSVLTDTNIDRDEFFYKTFINK